MRFADRFPRPARPDGTPALALLWAIALLTPALAWAHERWVPNKPRFPINRAYFQSMTGEVLAFGLAATASIFVVIVLWYLYVPDVVEALTPVTPSAHAREDRRGFFSRTGRMLVRFALDGYFVGPAMLRAQAISTFVFSKLPALVLGLGAYEGWLVMPSFPLDGPLALPLRVIEAALAVWALSGLLLPALGAVLVLVYVYLCLAYGIVAIDAIPVLASAFFYLFRVRGAGNTVSSRQLLGMRLSLGLGFFLLGLINKIYLAELFIGVGDQHPSLLAGPQALFPGLTREAWSFTTALGEMVFGLLLLIGVFNRITTLVLALIFTNFIAVFGWPEIVHVYPIAGFVLLFFRGQLGTSLDGLVFRTTVRFWHWLDRSSTLLVRAGAVTSVAASTAAGLFFVPLFAIVEVVPFLTGTAVAAGYVPPPLPPPAAQWGKIDAPAPSAAPAVPHADHRPRKGGVVMMNGDHHVELIVKPSGTVLIYLSDAVRSPIAASDARGTIRVERPGMSRTIALQIDPSGALIGSGPPPTVTSLYTYVLTIRGIQASTSLSVPAGGTASLVTPAR